MEPLLIFGFHFKTIFLFFIEHQILKKTTFISINHFYLNFRIWPCQAEIFLGRFPMGRPNEFSSQHRPKYSKSNSKNAKSANFQPAFIHGHIRKGCQSNCLKVSNWQLPEWWWKHEASSLNNFESSRKFRSDGDFLCGGGKPTHKDREYYFFFIIIYCFFCFFWVFLLIYI